MRIIKVLKWKELTSDGKKVDFDTVKTISKIISAVDPRELPMGLDSFRTMRKIDDTLRSANKSKKIKLEDTEYEFIKSLIEKSIPSVWGSSKNIYEAVDSFVNAKPEKK